METTRRSFLFGLGSLTALAMTPITAQFAPVNAAAVDTVTFKPFDTSAFKYFIKKPSQYYFNYNEENPPKLFGGTAYTDAFAEKEAEVIKEMIGDLIKDDDTPSFLDIFMNEESAADRYNKYIRSIHSNCLHSDYDEKEMMLDTEVKKTIDEFDNYGLTRKFYKTKEEFEKMCINSRISYEETINGKSLINPGYLNELPTTYVSRVY